MQNESQKNNLVPSQSELLNLLNYFQNDQYDLAEKTASVLSEKFPNHPFAWTVLGAVFNQTGKLDLALTACQKAAMLEPGKAEAHNNLGNTLLKLGRLEEAEKSCRQSIALEPRNELSQNNLGQILFRLHRLDEAEGAFRNAISIKQDYVQAYFNLGNTLKMMGKLEEAASVFTQASLIDSKNPELYVLQGITPELLARKPLIARDNLMKSINNGDWRSSEIFLKQTFEENPSHITKNLEEFISHWCIFCRKLIDQSDIKKLIQVFIKLIVIGERNNDVDNLIRLFFENIDIDIALELLKPDDEILVSLGYCQYNFLTENFKQAEAIAINNIQKAESLIKVPQTEDLGWLVVKRSLACCSQKDVSRTAFTNLVTNLVN